MNRSDLLLPSYLTSHLKSCNKKRKELAAELKVSLSYISQITSGATTPADDKLVPLSDVLGAGDRLPQFLLRAAHDRAESAPVRRCYLELIKRLDAGASTNTKPARRTLEHFPVAFNPLVVVTGDKREEPPKTAADLGAVSASPIDDRYIRKLPLSFDVEKISDKVFVLADDEFLREQFGKKNLFVIGSPASNHLARKLNAASLFKFAFERTTAEDINKIVQAGMERVEKQGLPGLKILQDERISDLKFIMHEFKQGGIFDPLGVGRQRIRARSLREGVDFATISIAQNPYAESNEYVAILASGFHLPGTIHAVRFLSESGHFAKHPLGGVLEVTLDTNLSWFRRIEMANSKWDNSAYTVPEMCEALESIADDDEAPTSKEEAQALLSLIRSMTSSDV